MIPHTRVNLKWFKCDERGRGLSLGGGSNHHQLKRKSVLSAMIPHTRVCIKWVIRAWLKLRGRAKPSPMKKELSAEFIDTSNKTLP